MVAGFCIEQVAISDPVEKHPSRAVGSMFKLLVFESDKSCCSQDGKEKRHLLPQKKTKTFLWAKKNNPMDVGVPTFGFELPDLGFASKNLLGWRGVLQAMMLTPVFSSQSFAKLSEADTLIT